MFFPTKQPCILEHKIYNDVLRNDQCQDIINYCEKNIEILSSKSKYSNNNNGWIDYSEETDPIFMIASSLMIKANKEHYQFELMGFNDPIRYIEYNGEKNHYCNWHIDVENKEITHYVKKLKAIILLNDPNDYEGGNFEFKPFPELDIKCKLNKGSCVVFPTFINSRITPVTKGIMKVVSFCGHGPQFR